MGGDRGFPRNPKDPLVKLHAQVPTSLLTELKRMAFVANTSLSDVVTTLIRQGLKPPE